MKKRKAVVFIVFLCALILSAAVIFNIRNRAQASSTQTAVVVRTEAVQPIVPEPVIPKVIPQEKQVPAPIAEAGPKTKIIERTLVSGNKGYIILNGVYVYNGIVTTIKEEVPANS